MIYTISGIELHTYIGMNEEERKAKRRIDIDVRIDTEDFIDLKEVYNFVRDTIEEKTYILIEDVTREILSVLKERYQSSFFTVRVRKPHPPIEGKVAYIECEIRSKE